MIKLKKLLKMKMKREIYSVNIGQIQIINISISFENYIHIIFNFNKIIIIKNYFIIVNFFITIL